MYKILIVEDDEVIARAIAQQVEAWGWAATCVEDFRNVLAQFTAFEPQLVLLDISLPFFNGYHWCSEIRKISRVPIIFISSTADNMNIVMAMNMGGDDFIAKPFDMSVLTAKVQALLRRAYDFGGQSHLIEHGGVLLNLGDATVHYGEEKLELTKNELKVLQLLLENAGHAVSRETLMTRLWETDSFVDENALSVGIARLRKKLECIGLGELVVTKKRIGYMVE